MYTVGGSKCMNTWSLGFFNNQILQKIKVARTFQSLNIVTGGPGIREARFVR